MEWVTVWAEGGKLTAHALAVSDPQVCCMRSRVRSRVSCVNYREYGVDLRLGAPLKRRCQLRFGVDGPAQTGAAIIRFRKGGLSD